MSKAQRAPTSPKFETPVRFFAILLEAVIVILLVVLCLEGISRIWHGGVRQMLPYVADEALGPRMPRNFDSKVQFSGSPPFQVCTDQYGMRGSPCGESRTTPKVLTVGDSQAFGWAMNFADSFTAKVAEGLGERAPDAARVMAAGGADVESLLEWAADYQGRSGRTHKPPGRLNIVLINLGNDLDEMYFGRSSGQVPTMQAAREWLTIHSYFMLDFNVLKAKLFPANEWTLPPGANPVVLALSRNERRQLALATADAALRLVRALPPAQQSVVLLLPNDYQVAKSEFEKYRKFYSNEAQFAGWKRRLDACIAALDDIEQQISQALEGQAVIAVAPRVRLATLDPAALFDRSSHHYSVYGQDVLAQAILEAVNNNGGGAGVGIAHAKAGGAQR